MSTARAKLFQLTELVRTSGDATVVVLEQRGGAEPVALVREARLAYLEERVKQLDARQQKPFTLAGSLASDLDDAALGQVLREVRRGWVSRAPDTSARTLAPKGRRRGR
jgi:fructose-1-phosphate kinase PfkB-like protein